MLTRQTDIRPNPARACVPEALGASQCRHLAAALSGFTPSWSVAIQYDVRGRATIVAQPEDFEHVVAPTFFIHVARSAFHLEELCGEDCRTLGEYWVWADVLRAVQIRLTWDMPIATTQH
jgi:hypothetical protein